MHDTLNLFADQTEPTSKISGSHEFRDTVARNGYHLDEMDIGDITFAKGQEESIHRWYRLTPSFAPALVRHFLKEFGADSSSVVLDPFSGRGTTVVECQKQGISAIGVEINPLLQQVGHNSLNWHRRADELFDVFKSELQKSIAERLDYSPEEVAQEANGSIPIIHNVYRWWNPNVLRDLIISRTLMRDARFENIKHFLWLAVNTASLECANIHRNHPTITFDDNHGRDISVFDELCFRIEHIRADLARLTSDQLNHVGRGRVVQGDARHLDPSMCSDHDAKIDFIITSPPYPNRFSYIHQTRPQLHFMELLDDRSQATDIDLQTIGGTWGKATSNLMKEYIEPPRLLRPLLTYIEELRPASLLMCNYATKYFIDLDSHIVSLRKLVGKGFRGAYVVGNSRLSGVEIYTECILASMFERHGFTVDKIIMFRKRGGRQRLYETAICIRL